MISKKVILLLNTDDAYWIDSIQEIVQDLGIKLVVIDSYAKVSQEIYMNDPHDCAFIIIKDILEKQRVYVHQLKESMRSRVIPVAGIIDDQRGDDAHKMIESGYDFLIKPSHHPHELYAICKAAVEDFERKLCLKAFLHKPFIVEEGETRSIIFRTMDEAELLTELLANLCPNPTRALVGLQELLVNAIEHGNIAITYDEKTQLQLNNTWQNEIRQRLQDLQYIKRLARVDITRHAGRLIFKIIDEGAGFDWKKYIRSKNQASSESHGRGILIAESISFDEITYQGTGNIALATIYTHPKP